MKILCICEHGNVRSVALAYILKSLFRQEAIAVGWKEVSDETMNMLFNWADRIIILDRDYYLSLASDKEPYLFDVGEDIWHDANDQGLVHKLYKELRKYPELWQVDNNRGK